MARCEGRAPQRRRSICFGRMPARTAESSRSASSARTGARSGGGADLRPRRACDRDPAAPARLQLARGGERVANGSGQVGRNLIDHATQSSWALAAEPVWPYRGPLSTSGIESLATGRSGRSAERSASRSATKVGPGPPARAPTAAALAGQGLRGTALDAALAEQCSRHIRLAAGVEQLPDPENRVDLDPDAKDVYGVPRPRRTTTPRPASLAREAHAANSRRRQ